METEPIRVTGRLLVGWTYGQVLTRLRTGLLSREQLRVWEQEFYKKRLRWPDEAKDWCQKISGANRGGRK